MDIIVKNINGVNENVSVIRYFQFNGSNYLIFTKNEIDESGYQKLYISKVSNMIGNSITDEVEWNLLRDTIKIIARANKDNTTLPVQDLNDLEVNGIQITGEKPFKLTSSSVSLLSANKDSVTNSNLNNVTVGPDMSPVMPSVMNDNAMPKVNNSDIGINDAQYNNTQSESIPSSNDIIAESGNMFEDNTSIPSSINGNTIPTPATLPVADLISQPTEQTVNEMNMNLNDNTNFTTFFDNNLQPNFSQDYQMQSNSVNANNSNLESILLQSKEPIEPAIDYKKMYEEQTLKLNGITAELNNYKNIIEQLKNILN